MTRESQIHRSWARRLALWLGDEARIPDSALDALSPVIDALPWLACRIEGHAPFLEMDNRTTCCAYCGKVLDIGAVGICPAGYGECPCLRGSISHAHCLAQKGRANA